MERKDFSVIIFIGSMLFFILNPRAVGLCECSCMTAQDSAQDVGSVTSSAFAVRDHTRTNGGDRAFSSAMGLTSESPTFQKIAR